MFTKQIKTITMILCALTLLILAADVTASSSVAGHGSVRKVILVSGYDFQNNFPGGDYLTLHTRSEELPGWQSIIDYLTLDKGTLENALVRQIGLTNADIFLFSYSDIYDDNCETGVRYGCPIYTARDTCLGIGENGMPNRVAYCQVEDSAIAWEAERLTNILHENSDAEFDIIAHSEGGIVATYWAATADPGDLQRVNSIITLDSPLQGAVLGPSGAIQFMTDPVKAMVALAPRRVPVYTIRNIQDMAVPWQYATLDNVWNDSGRNISTSEGQGAHEPRNDPEVLQRIALALVAGKIILPNSAHPEVVGPGEANRVFGIQIAKPTFTNLRLLPTDVQPLVGGQAPDWWFGLGFDAVTNFTGRSIIAARAPDKTAGVYPLTHW